MKRLLLILCILASGRLAGQQLQTLRVMSYNIHHANPPSKPDLIDLDAIAKVISDQRPDLVALQEVDVKTKRAAGVDQAKALAKKLKMKVYFAKAIDHDGGDYGVAILSRFPITETRTFPLPNKQGVGAEPRVLATARIKLPGKRELTFASTHLDAQRDHESRRMQAGEIVAKAALFTGPFILAGDLNATAGSGPVNILDKVFTRTCKDCAPTIPVINPKKTIDHIAFANASPMRVLSHEVINEQYASDHLPVIAVLQL